MLKSNDQKSMGHVGYWMWELLGDLVPGIDDGVHANDVPTYYDYLAQLVVEGTTCDLLSQGNWKILTSKAIYLHHERTFPEP